MLHLIHEVSFISSIVNDNSTIGQICMNFLKMGLIKCLDLEIVDQISEVVKICGQNYN